MKKLSAVLLVFAILIQTLCFTLCYAEIGGFVSGGGGYVVASFNEEFTTPYGETVKIKYYDYTNEFAITMSDFFQARTDAYIFTAIYKNDVLQEVFCDTYVADTNTTFDTHYYETGEVDSLSDYTIKFFVWDENMKPLREAYNPTGYESAMLGKITASNGEESVTLLSDTGETLTLQMAENYVIYDGIYTYTSLEEFENEYSTNALLGTYIYYNLNQGKIDKIITMDYHHNGFDVYFNKDGSSLGGATIDKDSVVFFPEYNDDGSVNFEQSTVGTVADLSEDLLYTYTAYTNSYSKNGNRIVIKKVELPYVADTGAISVITDVSINLNGEGEDVFFLNYYCEGELFTNIYTTNEVYNNNKNDITVGDIVNLEISGGIITKINKRVDFAEGVRYRDTGLISATTLASGNSTYTDDTQSYTYGYATEYNKLLKIVTINGKEYKLNSTSDYVYVVDNSGRKLTVEHGAVTDFEWDEDITSDYDKYADWLFVREYDGSIKEVVIIKSVLGY